MNDQWKFCSVRKLRLGLQKSAPTFVILEELHHIRENMNMDLSLEAQQNASELTFDASEDTPEHQIHPTDQTKMARVLNSLTPT
jgi:hypothetical protein